MFDLQMSNKQNMWHVQKQTQKIKSYGDVYVWLCVLQVSVVGDTVNVSGQSNCTPVKVPECKLSDDLGVLFERSSFSDVTLYLGGREFSAHKAVLAGRYTCTDI